MALTDSATKGDLQELKAEIDMQFDTHTKVLMNYIDMRSKEDKEEIFAYIRSEKEDTMRHFDLTVETIRHDLLGANKDSIEVLKDKAKDHEKRIRVLERGGTAVITAQH